MMQNIEVIKWMSLLGIPTIFAMVAALTRMLIGQGKKISILMAAQQAQMRRDLMEDYYRHKANGYISSRDIDDWEAQYQAYHALGANGVLDARRAELLELPTRG